MFLACRQTLEILLPCCARDRWVAWWVPSALCKSLELVHDLYLLFGAAECLARQYCGSCVTSKVLHIECSPYLRAHPKEAQRMTYVWVGAMENKRLQHSMNIPRTLTSSTYDTTYRKPNPSHYVSHNAYHRAYSIRRPLTLSPYSTALPSQHQSIQVDSTSSQQY